MSRGRRGIKSSDQFPNFLTGQLVQLANDTLQAVQIFTPIPRLKTIGNRATVMELLWIDMELDIQMNAINAEYTIFFSIGTLPDSFLRFNDTRVFAMFKASNMETAAGASGRGLARLPKIVRYEMQTKDGFGYLLASDAFNFVLDTENTGRQNGAFWRMYYRFVDIPLAEFVGIVQSNQQS